MTELQDPREQKRQERQRKREERRQRWMSRQNHEFGSIHSKHGRVWTGLFILLIGLAALLRTTVPQYFGWLFTWEVLLIAIGLFIGVRHNFRGVAWLILVLIGSIFLTNRFYNAFTFQYIWPLVLIVIGMYIIMRPRTRFNMNPEQKAGEGSHVQHGYAIGYSKEDYVENTSIFGGAKKIIISKNFKGGDLVNIFGGTELDLSQADFAGTAIIDLTTIFGGTKLLVPSNWSVRTEKTVTIFGGIEDKRKMQTITEAPDKTLVIQGTVIFGGIEIKSF